MPIPTETRRPHRTIGHGLVILIDGHAHPVLDISTAGVAYQAGRHPVGATIAVTLARLDAISDCIAGKITVISSQESITRGEFKPTVPLLSYILSHIGAATGAEPAYFRK